MKRYIALFISYVPINIMRIILYRLLMGYNISYSAKIGIGTIIAVRSLRIDNVNINRFNKFIGPFDLLVKKPTLEAITRLLVSKEVLELHIVKLEKRFT